jgi:hypothetical protein
MLINESRKNEAGSSSRRLSETSGHQIRRRRSRTSSSNGGISGDRQKVQTSNVWIPPVDQYINKPSCDPNLTSHAHNIQNRASVIRSDFGGHWGRSANSLLYHPHNHQTFQAVKHAQTQLTTTNGLAHSSSGKAY